MGFSAKSGLIFVVLLVVVVVLGIVTWKTQPSESGAGSAPPSAWTAPKLPTQSTSAAPLPPGFPSMEFPPPMPTPAPGRPLIVPTKFGLSYAVPNSGDWVANNSTVVGWSAGDELITLFGAAAQYDIGYCAAEDSEARARVGATGRNGVDIGTAARDEVNKAARIYGDEKTGRQPRVAISTPVDFEVSGRPAVRYTATVTDIPHADDCDPAKARFDVVATPGYASAEVMLFMVASNTGTSGDLSDTEIDRIIGSIQKTAG